MVLTFGEILLRMSPKLGGEWIKKAEIPTFIGGAELNVATALAKWNIPVEYGSALPDNPLSRDIEAYLQSRKIGTRNMVFSGDRIGIYMLPQGADLKNSGVIYDRAYSSFSFLKKEDTDWDKFFEGITFFQMSAISPALNQNVADLCIEAAKQASQRGIKVLFDLNYRSKLWKYGKDPIEIVSQIVPYCDGVMGNIWAANTLLGMNIDPKVAAHELGKDGYIRQAEETSRQIISRFEKVKTVALTFRFDAGAGIKYYATLWNEDRFVVSKELNTDLVTDKVGSGDCFMAGLIYGLYNQHDTGQIINFAAAASFGKLQEYGDATNQTVEDVLKILEKN